LHDWNLEQEVNLIQTVNDALPPGGVLICIEPLLDDARRGDAFASSMSLNMLVEFGGAFGFTGDDFTDWCTKVRFERVDIVHLAGPTTALIPPGSAGPVRRCLTLGLLADRRSGLPRPGSFGLSQGLVSSAYRQVSLWPRPGRPDGTGLGSTPRASRQCPATGSALRRGTNGAGAGP